MPVSTCSTDYSCSLNTGCAEQSPVSLCVSAQWWPSLQGMNSEKLTLLMVRAQHRGQELLLRLLLRKQRSRLDTWVTRCTCGKRSRAKPEHGGLLQQLCSACYCPEGTSCTTQGDSPSWKNVLPDTFTLSCIWCMAEVNRHVLRRVEVEGNSTVCPSKNLLKNMKNRGL